VRDVTVDIIFGFYDSFPVSADWVEQSDIPYDAPPDFRQSILCAKSRNF